MKNAGIGAAILLVGIAVGYSLRGTPESSPQAPAPVHADQESADGRRLRDIQEKLARFSTQDLEDYVRLKNLEEKYRKADELVGKMILILLADVGIRVSMEQERFAKNPPRHEPPPRPTPSPVAKPMPDRFKEMRDRAERRLRDPHLGNPDTTLRMAKFDRFSDELSKSTPMTTVDSVLNGCFDGDARLDNKSYWLIHLAISIESRNGALVGQSLIELTENGRVFSRSAHDGSQQSFRRVPDSTAIIFEASDSIYFQLYPLSGGEALAGNIYTKDSSGKFSYKGTTVLGRTGCLRPSS